MFPNLPYPGYSWSMTQHMAVVNPIYLYQTLYAAATYSGSTDPAQDINNYIIANGLLTPNVRADTGQPDAWRDYQQILPELGLMFSTEVQRPIAPTFLGLSYLDGAIGFSEVITLQALRYQYPNGNKVVISPGLRRALAGTQFSASQNLAELQASTGVQFRPAVLIWRVLQRLHERLGDSRLTLDEMQSYLLRCSRHSDTNLCADAIVNMRWGNAVLPVVGAGRQRRNLQDWIKLLLLTPLFTGSSGRNTYLHLSAYSLANVEDISNICQTLEDDAMFWMPGNLNIEDRKSWYSQFGSYNVGVPLIPEVAEEEGVSSAEEFVGGREEDVEEAKDMGTSTRVISLRPFDPASLGAQQQSAGDGRGTIVSSYDAGLAKEKHRLHDLMVIYIARTCVEKGAVVYDDPDTVDLLVQFNNSEFLVEVKSVTPRNFTARLRFAIGQVLQYDYLRSAQTQLPRRKVIAIAARVPPASWSIPFLNSFLDIDLLSLDGQVMRVDSTWEVSRQLFVPTLSQAGFSI